jgi:hypothetical protein
MSGINTSSRETEAEARKLVALGKLQVAWPSRDQGAAEMRLALYLEQLLPYSPESVGAACSAWMRTGSRFPTLADLVALVEPIERRREYERQVEWTPAPHTVFEAMSVREKVRELQLLAMQELDRATKFINRKAPQSQQSRDFWDRIDAAHAYEDRARALESRLQSGDIAEMMRVFAEQSTAGQSAQSRAEPPPPVSGPVDITGLTDAMKSHRAGQWPDEEGEEEEDLSTWPVD